MQSPQYIPLFEMESSGPSRTLADGNCSVKVWNTGRSESSPQRSSHIASVSSLSRQPSGWTPRTGQPRVLASRETPLHGWRTDHIVPTTRVSPLLSAPVRWRWKRDASSVARLAQRANPQEVVPHTLTEQLLADRSCHVSTPEALRPGPSSSVASCQCSGSEIPGCVNPPTLSRLPPRAICGLPFFESASCPTRQPFRRGTHGATSIRSSAAEAGIRVVPRLMPRCAEVTHDSGEGSAL